MSPTMLEGRMTRKIFQKALKQLCDYTFEGSSTIVIRIEIC